MLPKISKGQNSLLTTDNILKQQSAANNNKTGKGDNLGEYLNKLTSGTATGEATKTKVKNNDELNKEDFMTLLVAELKNQNPLEPMDNQEFSSHLAQFSQLEQLETMNKNINKMASSNEPITKLYSASLIGRSVVTESTDVNHEKGKPEEFSFVLKDDNVSKVEVGVVDNSGRTIRKIKVDKFEPGLNYVKWDGKGDDGMYADDGNYKFDVVATDQHGTQIQVERGIKGEVVSVDYKGNNISLVLDSGNRVLMQDVKSINDGSKTAIKAYQQMSKEEKKEEPKNVEDIEAQKAQVKKMDLNEVIQS